MGYGHGLHKLNINEPKHCNYVIKQLGHQSNLSASGGDWQEQRVSPSKRTSKNS